ncbi:MAG: hypothetical protein H0Z37_08385 [Firmicutes bacterium]|nr:hypothetical protein [Bacillota bacterium]
MRPLLRCVDEVHSRYYRLLLAGPPGSAETALLRRLAAAAQAPYINVSLALSRRTLPLTELQRTLRLPPLSNNLSSARRWAISFCLTT